MPTTFIRVILFLSSYAPLFLILAIQYRHSYWAVVVFVAAAIVPTLVLFLYLEKLQKLSPHSIDVKDVASKGGEAMSYIVTYLLPFFGMDLTDFWRAAPLLIVFVVIGIIYINSNLLFINPMLNVRGYQVFEIVDSNENRALLLTKREFIPRGTTVSVISSGGQLLMEKR